MRFSLIASFLIHAGAVAALLGIAVRAGSGTEPVPATLEFAIESEALEADSLHEPKHHPTAPATPSERFPAVHEEDPEPVVEEFTVRPLPLPEATDLPRFARLARPLRDPRAPVMVTPAVAAQPAAPAVSTLVPPKPVEGRCPAPAYPRHAVDVGLEGVVFLRVRISPEGRVAACEIHTSSGHESLDDAAAEAVRNWRFDPARRDGEARAHWLRIPIRFRLRD